MNNFIEQNRRLLTFYYRAMRIGGWFFFLLSLAALIGHSVALISRHGDPNEFNRYWENDVPWGMFTDLLPTGLLAIGISQFIRYLLKTDSRAGWILRNAYKMIYTYTGILVIYYCWAATAEVIAHYNDPGDFPLRMIFVSLFIIFKLLALVGIAEIARRMLPMIEESRTLV